MSERVLVVGAGAVGQVFAHHLARGGAEVALLVKPAHEAALREGMTLYRLRRRGPLRERFEGYRILTAPSQAAGTRWDQVYSAVSSAALRPATWFAELARATGDATVVFLQPNIDDRAIATTYADPQRLVDGMIGFIAYHSPLPGVTDDRDRDGGAPGMAFWLPPGSPSRFAGDELRTTAVIDALRRGGLPASRMDPSSFAAVTPFANAVLYACIATLQAAGWSLAALADDRWLERLGAVATESLTIVSDHLQLGIPLGARLVTNPLVLRAALRLAPAVVPLPLEPYLRAHFTKVGPQMRLGLAAYAQLGAAAGLPTDALAQLCAAIDPALQPAGSPPLAGPVPLC
ncbi:MAG: ketopantoate reductase [Nannocystaceae bacterium]|nr:ketopantoate reductase [Nannocystaceae bacterium]